MSSGADDIETPGNANAFPQRWRVEGEGKYEQTSAIRYLDGWAETFPALLTLQAVTVNCLRAFRSSLERSAGAVQP